ncbi:hypothetical protein E2C01_071972 [Portunus trituberculatus]|uniref:Uncharacterized protein n=1 Tax=Portunus trituberculatus TaxID=210409 RepID=A0A5B7I9V4_PORTR|nr:hypothetical protein [Portunus trituberculatus]
MAESGTGPAPRQREADCLHSYLPALPECPLSPYIPRDDNYHGQPSWNEVYEQAAAAAAAATAAVTAASTSRLGPAALPLIIFLSGLGGRTLANILRCQRKHMRRGMVAASETPLSIVHGCKRDPRSPRQPPREHQR